MLAAYVMVAGRAVFGFYGLCDYCPLRARADVLAALPASTSPAMRHFITECTLVVEQERRWSAAQLRGHPLFEGMDWATLNTGCFPDE